MQQATLTAIKCRQCKKGLLYDDGRCHECGKADGEFKEKNGKALSIVWQLLSSPVLSVVMLLAGIYAWVLINGGNDAIERKTAADPLLVINMFNFVNISFVILGIFIIWFARRNKRYILGAYLLIIPMVFGTLMNGGMQYFLKNSPDAVNTAVSSVTGEDTKYYVMDARIEALATELGIDKENLRNAKPQIGKPEGGVCGKVQAIGCYNGTIYIYPEALKGDRLEQRSILAHEYLHYVWDTASPADKERLSPYLNIMYGKYAAAFDRRTKDYETSGTLPGSADYTNELHSFMGTEISDAKLHPVLLEWYKKWLPNRNALPSYL